MNKFNFLLFSTRFYFFKIFLQDYAAQNIQDQDKRVYFMNQPSFDKNTASTKVLSAINHPTFSDTITIKVRMMKWMK